MRERSRILRYMLLILILAGLLAAFSGCKRYRRVTKETDAVTMGIDVARYQGTIDWQEVSQADVDFAIVRIGYRGMADGKIKPDPNGRYNLQEAAKAGIPLGVYFFSTAVTEEEAEACERNDFECMKCEAECKCKSCRNGSSWEWRGAKEK